MADPITSGVSSIEEQSDLGTGDVGLYAYWMGQEDIADKAEQDWHKRGDAIVKRYRDERPSAQQGRSTDAQFNILWSNVQTLLPTLYARTPKPDVDRRFKDDSTPAARYSAILLERCLQFICDTGDFDAVMKPVVQDKLLPGRGVARVLYVPHFGDKIEEPPAAPDQPALQSQALQSPGGEVSTDVQQTPQVLGSPEVEDDEKATWADADRADAATDSPGDDKKESEREVVYEEVKFKYIYWKDYREGPARQWDEVPWVRYRSYLTRNELKERFGAAKAMKINLDFTPDGHTEKEKSSVPPDLFKKAVIHEYWDKQNRKVLWLAPKTPDLILDNQDDPLGLPDFFPNPDPLLATTTTDTRIPVPDYAEYQDQAKELDLLTARINRLRRALQVKGIYPGEHKQELQQLIDEGTENSFIPVQDYQSWSDSGGLKNFIEYLPIQQIAEALIQLYDARDREKAILYELTGIGDIMRGMTSPDETLGAQELKSVFATRRISPQQKDAAIFARGLLRLAGAVIAGHFSDKTISLITGYPQLAPVPQLPPPPVANLAVNAEIQQHQQAMAAAQQQPPQGSAPTAGTVVAPQAGGNVVQMAPGGMAQSEPTGVAPQPPPLSQAAQQYMQQQAQWAQMQQAVQQIQQSNQKKQADFTAACKLIRDDGVHGFKIDIEADSTIAPDEQAEKAARTEFLKEFVPFMQLLMPLAMGNPPMAELAKQICLFAVRAFPAARPLEETIEQAFDAAAKMPPVPPPGATKGKQGPSPQDLAVRTQEIASRERIANQTNAVKMANIHQDARADAERLEADQERDRTELALKVGRAAKQDALAGARLTHIESQNAGGLV